MAKLNSQTVNAMEVVRAQPQAQPAGRSRNREGGRWEQHGAPLDAFSRLACQISSPSMGVCEQQCASDCRCCLSPFSTVCACASWVRGSVFSVNSDRSGFVCTGIEEGINIQQTGIEGDRMSASDVSSVPIVTNQSHPLFVDPILRGPDSKAARKQVLLEEGWPRGEMPSKSELREHTCIMLACAALRYKDQGGLGLPWQCR